MQYMSYDDQPGDPEPQGPPQDVALVHGLTAEGDLRVLRKRAERVELGAVRPLREGIPIQGEVVRLTPRKEFPLLCDVESVFVPPNRPADVPALRKGPVQVASEDYRKNWDVIWSQHSKQSMPS